MCAQAVPFADSMHAQLVRNRASICADLRILARRAAEALSSRWVTSGRGRRRGEGSQYWEGVPGCVLMAERLKISSVMTISFTGSPGVVCYTTDQTRNVKGSCKLVFLVRPPLVFTPLFQLLPDSGRFRISGIFKNLPGSLRVSDCLHTVAQRIQRKARIPESAPF